MTEPRTDGAVLDWRAIGSAALVGLALIVPITILGSILDRSVGDFQNSGWRVPLFLAILVTYAVAGWWAARLAPSAPLTNGALAGLGTFALWIPLRVLIWLVRDESKELFTGHEPVFKIGQVFGQFVLAVAVGMVGGWLASRRQAATGGIGGRDGRH